MKKYNVFPLNKFCNVAHYEVEFLKKIHINSLNSKHDIHTLLDDWNYLFIGFFATDVVRTQDEVHNLLLQSKRLENLILELSN